MKSSPKKFGGLSIVNALASTFSLIRWRGVFSFCLVVSGWERLFAYLARWDAEFLFLLSGFISRVASVLTVPVFVDFSADVTIGFLWCPFACVSTFCFGFQVSVSFQFATLRVVEAVFTKMQTVASLVLISILFRRD